MKDTTTLHVVVTRQEFARLRKQAADNKMSLSAYLRVRIKLPMLRHGQTRFQVYHRLSQRQAVAEAYRL